MIASRLQVICLTLTVALAAPAAARGGENEVASKTFPMGAEGVVTVQATTGIIRVGIWDRDEVRVETIKRTENKELLDQLRVEITSGFNDLTVVTDIARGTGALGETLDVGTIDLGLTIPRRAQLEVTATNANVKIEGVRGDAKVRTTTGAISTLDLAGAVTIESTHGPIQASFGTVREDQRINVTSEHGTIRLLLPQSVAAFLQARSARGSVKCELALTVDDGPDGGRQVDGALNTGGAHITCETQSGGILILKRL